MKKFLIVVTLPIAAAFLSTSAMAATGNHSPQNHNAHASQNNQKWRSGQYLPNNYQSSRFAVDHRKYRQLSQPGRGQKWYKVQNSYVLVNTKNHLIIRVL